MAAKLARRAIRLRHTLRPAWLLLSRCYVRLGLYSLALITLNVVPPPPPPAPELVRTVVLLRCFNFNVGFAA